MGLESHPLTTNHDKDIGKNCHETIQVPLS